MAIMRPVTRRLLKRKEFKKYIKKCKRGDIEWKDKKLLPMKNALRLILRKEQNETCVYCQRLITIERRNTQEDIEHYLDKSKPHYRKYTFSPINLVLSCHTCNFVKSTKDTGGPTLRGGGYVSLQSRDFRWPHPYIDDIEKCIVKLRGPVYEIVPGSGKELESENMIEDLRLNDIANIESREAYLKSRNFKIMDIVSDFMSSNNNSVRLRTKRLLEESRAIQKEIY